jgi:hypothetical protein
MGRTAGLGVRFRADQAMSLARINGRDQVWVWRPADPAAD